MPSPHDPQPEVPPSPVAGRLLVLSAAILWSTSGLFAKSSIFADWPAAHQGLLFAFWRALFAGALLLPLVRGARWNVKLVPMTACFALMNVCFLLSLTWSTAANAIWLQSTAPMWILIFSVVLLNEPVNRRDLLPLAFSAVGIGVILYHELLGGGATVSHTGTSAALAKAGVLLGLIAGVCYCGVVMFSRSLRTENAVWLVALNHLVAAVVMLPVFAYLCAHHDYWPDARQLVVLAAFGFFQMGFPYVLFIRGLKTVPSQEASLIALLEPVLVPVWVLLVSDETRWWSLLGGGFILIGLLLRYIRRPRTPSPSGDC